MNAFAGTPTKKKKRRVAFFVFALFALLTLGSAWSAYSLVRDLPDPERITERAVAQSTKIYDRTGSVLLYEIHGEEKRTVIPFDQVPESVKRATLAAEDVHFYSHPGIDWRGILRALAKNIARGDITQGGSTITQQLVKKSLLGDERTYTRKIKEVIIALLLERKYSKDEIFGLYLNQIPYGSNAYGIAAAAETYFAKTPQDLTIPEAAILAALPKAPTYYSPYGSHRDELMARKNRIIEQMADAGFIARERVGDLQGEIVGLVPPNRGILAPHFVLFVRELLSEKYGEEFVEQGGLRVITSLDWRLQQEAEAVVREGAERNEELVAAKNAALVALDPRSGQILAMVGSRDYFNLENDGNVNVATRPRQPGSAFKPFVYATAFKKGLTPATVLFDAPTEFSPLCNPNGTPGPRVRDPKDCYHPQNYDLTFRGPVTMRQAIAQSLNVPSVKVLYLAGINDSIQTARAMGITTLTEPDRYGLSLVLGGAEVTLLDMTSAYGVFAQEGILHAPAGILRVENAQGSILEEWKDEGKPVVDTEVARIINDVLSDNEARVPVFRRTSALYFPERRVAAKTGTTQDFRDAWTIGYTPSLVAGVWVGNNNNEPIHQNVGSSIMVAGPIWRAFMDLALKNAPPEDFAPPEPEHPDKPILRGLYRAGEIITIDTLSAKRATEHTPLETRKEISLGAIVSILASVNPDDPLGPGPETPDPQFKNWQAGIDQWLKEHPIPEPVPPADFDAVHTPASAPVITLAEDQPHAGPRAEITAFVRTTFPIREVSLFVNDELRGVRTGALAFGSVRFALDPVLGPGEYRIKIIAHDSVGNRGTHEETIVVRE
ncbi:MAG: penicillin-binding protein [Candidatus Sungbacteria bacterium]|nr:penicillin-binding protein [Candidatus Sungbacteria bacterium]